MLREMAREAHDFVGEIEDISGQRVRMGKTAGLGLSLAKFG